MIISDDGSNDRSKEYLRSLSDPRIRVHFQPANLGIFDNLNFLFDQSTSSITQILCQDDVFSTPESLQQIVDFWNADKNHDVDVARFNQTGDAHCALTRYFEQNHPPTLAGSQLLAYMYVCGNILGNLSNLSLRTGVVERGGGFSQSYPYAGDFELWARLAGKIVLAVVDAKVITVRRHDATASSQLNLHGELLTQLGSVYSFLYRKITLENVPVDLLCLFGTINFDSQHRYIGLKNLLITGDNSYLKALNQLEDCPFLLGSIQRKILAVLSLGGRIGRAQLGIYLLQRLNNQSEL